MSLDGLGRGTSEALVAGVVVALAGVVIVASAGVVVVAFAGAGVVTVALAGVIPVILAGVAVALAGVVVVALAAALKGLAGASLLGIGAAELRRVSDLREGSFQDFSFVSLLYQYFLPLTSYSFHGWLARAGTPFVAGALIGVAVCGAALAADFGAGPFAAVATCAVGSFHDFSLVSLLYQYFFPVKDYQTCDFGEKKGVTTYQ